MRTYAKMKVPGFSGLTPSLSVGISIPNVFSAPLTDFARCHYEHLLSAGFPSRFRCLYSGVAAYLGDAAIPLLDFKTLHEFDVFSQIPERYVQEDRDLTLLEDTYSFLRWNGLFFGASQDGFGQRCVVRQRVLSCTIPLAEHEGDFTVLSQGETVRHAFDTFVYSKGWLASGILFEQRSDDRLLSAVLHISGRRGYVSPYGMG